MESTKDAARRSRRTLALLVGCVAALALAASACVTPAPAPADPPPPPADGYVGQRQIMVQLSGSTSYYAMSTVDSGRLVSRWNGANVGTVTGTVGFAGAGGPATATFDLVRSGTAYDGTVTIDDPGAGIAETVTHSQVSITFDGDGDATALATDGGTQLRWTTDTLRAEGLVPELDALTALEDDFCTDAQRSLVGVDEADLEVVETNYTDRNAFVDSKVDYGPLGVHRWSDPDMATTADGETVAISHRISCKTSSSDKLASLGVATSPDLQCSTLTAASLEAARALMTEAEKLAYDTTGLPVALMPDELAVAGPVWLAPFDDEVDTGTALEVTSSALVVNWTDPDYFILPESFRGVHYCTVWSPAWAYWWMTVGAFA